MIFLMCYHCGSDLIAQGICGNDDSELFNPDPYPNCSIPTASQCLKIKFHYLINPVNGGNIPSPEDSYYAKLLKELNLFYDVANISFSVLDECIERGQLQNPVTTVGEFSDAIIDNVTKLPKSGSNYKEDYINIYGLSTTLSGPNNFTYNGYAYGTLNNPNKWAFVRFDGNDINRDVTLLAHEIGHLFSLRHTYSRGTSNSSHEVKSRTALDALGRGIRCEHTGDWLCDTGADPYDWTGFTIDPIQINCSQNPAIIPSVPDVVNDITTAWDIPVTNIMSYYFSCRQVFSNCQISSMLNEISKKYGAFLTECEETEPPIECLDIEINDVQSWSNNILKLCPDQKIIIGPYGHLTLDNYTLTKKENANSECPELSGNWDGIYLQSGSGGASMPGGPPTAPGSRLTVLNGSIIEFSDNGIQAPNSHSGININGSTMRKNGIVMDVKSPALIGGSGINITTSMLSNHSYGKEVMLRIIGSNLTMSGSHITNNNNKLSVTGIKAFKNSLRIVNTSSINNVSYGIDKELGSIFPHGLVIENSRINSTNIAIRNRGSKVTARKNYINGKTDHLGKAIGLWYGNNFREEVKIDDPGFSYEFIENNFYVKQMLLKRNQFETNATCNTWQNTASYAVDVDLNVHTIKSAWGSEPISSGNIHDGSAPLMYSETSDITNFHYLLVQNSIFTYGNKFIGRFAQVNNSGCLYNQFPSLNGPGQGGTSIPIYNDSTNQNLWSAYNQQYQQAISQMPHQDDSIQTLLTIASENALVGMGQCVLDALNHADSTMSSSSYQLWAQRMDPILFQMDTIIHLLNDQDFESLADYIGDLNASTYDLDDQTQMLEIAEWLISASGEGLDIFELNQAELDSLSYFSSIYFGPYTSALRGFLNAYYDIRIDPSEELNQYTKRYSHPIRNRVNENTLIVFPNPGTDCIKIYPTYGSNSDGIIKVSSIDSRIIQQFSYQSNQEICVKGVLPSGIYLLELTLNKSQTLFKGKLVIY